MKEIEIVIQNQSGLHARPAKVLVNLAKQFKSTISLHHKGKRANAKSMVSVLTLGAVCGSEITVQVEGVDEAKAVLVIEAAIHSGLGDDNTPTEPQPIPAEPKVPIEVPVASQSLEPGVIKGVGAAPGIAVGPIFHFLPVELDLENLEALSAENQIGLAEALTCAREQLAQLYEQMTAKKLGAEAAIFEAHRELLDDPELLEAVQARVTTGQSSVRAWKTTIDEQAAAIAALNDPLLAARADDLRDVGKRVLGLLLGVSERG